MALRTTGRLRVMMPMPSRASKRTSSGDGGGISGWVTVGLRGMGCGQSLPAAGGCRHLARAQRGPYAGSCRRPARHGGESMGREEIAALIAVLQAEAAKPGSGLALGTWKIEFD